MVRGRGDNHMDMEICCGLCASPDGIGKTCPRWGGVLTDVSKLPVGTKFSVHNGYWDGKIVLINGKHCVNAGGKHISEIVPGYEGNILALSGIKYPEES